MNEYLFVFRRDYKTPGMQPSPQKLQEHMKHWADWYRSLAATDKLSRPVQRLDSQGKVVNNKITEGPFAELTQSIGGIVFINASSYEEAVEIAKDCPVFEFGGTVEIRQGL